MVGGDGAAPIYLLSETQGKSLLNSVNHLDSDCTVFDTTELAPENAKKDLFATEWQILNGDHRFTVDSPCMNAAKAGTD